MENDFFGTEKIAKILMKMAPPVMLAQLIQALYNVVDSFFVGRYSESGLTALSIIYPIQLLMIALAVGTGVGINTEMAYNLGIGKKKRSDDTAGIGTPLALVMWVLFAGVCFFLMPAYARMNTSSEEVIAMVVSYGRIVCVLSIGLFLESVWTKVHQAEGNMRVPMIAQIVGAVVNIVLDPFLIFGLCGLPKMGIAGAATATVVGQIAAAVIVMKGGCRKIPKLVVFPHQIKRIYKLGIPNILMQSAYTFYIFGLNLLLATFSDQAVTVLGLYYKWQAFFFIPLGAMQTCIVPVVSYNFAAGKYERCKKTLKVAIGFGVALMMIGVVAFRFIGISFVPLVSSLTFPVFFQALGHAATSSILTIIRTVFLFIPLAYLFSRFGLNWFWLTFPVTDSITTLAGYLFYRKFNKSMPSVAVEA